MRNDRTLWAKLKSDTVQSRDAGVARNQLVVAHRRITLWYVLQIEVLWKKRTHPFGLSAVTYCGASNCPFLHVKSIVGHSLRGAKRAQLYFDCLRRLLDAERAGEVNRATTRLLGAVVDTYLSVDVEDRTALRGHLQATGGDVMAIEATELTWRDQVEMEGATRAEREFIRELVRRKFERVSPEIESLIDRTEAEDDLKALFGRAIDARTESDLLRQT